MKRRLKKKLEKRQALFKSHAEHRAIGHTQRLVNAHQRTQNNTHKATAREG
ncbi:hypothetical protein JOC95_002684 [Bacillus tianshenii]|uniref:Uncharacterized protein n=1 Tax=Sutcliffiella tianshenii TaxID=1463404 RepID=A0ABS2P1S2_9BACI|nr:hypothetical protein [Bacillus tianshenii]MBM7620829.1 hypothetical protein [Bacillus tianshenii]MCA1321233.1 hypothetical protein [Bacillus tianshenii]